MNTKQFWVGMAVLLTLTLAVLGIATTAVLISAEWELPVEKKDNPYNSLACHIDRVKQSDHSIHLTCVKGVIRDRSYRQVKNQS